MNLTTENAGKFIGVKLWEWLPGNHIQQIEVFNFPDGSFGYRRIKTGVCSPVPAPSDKFNAVDIIKVDFRGIER